MPIRTTPGRPTKGDPPAPSRRRTVDLPVEVDDALQALAARHGISLHAELRRGLMLYAAQAQDWETQAGGVD